MPEELQTLENQTAESPATPRRDYRQEVTNQIIEMLERARRRGKRRGNQVRCNSRLIQHPTERIEVGTPFISWPWLRAKAMTTPDG
jgi:hypothetical protein